MHPVSKTAKPSKQRKAEVNRRERCSIKPPNTMIRAGKHKKQPRTSFQVPERRPHLRRPLSLGYPGHVKPPQKRPETGGRETPLGYPTDCLYWRLNGTAVRDAVEDSIPEDPGFPPSTAARRSNPPRGFLTPTLLRVNRSGFDVGSYRRKRARKQAASKPSTPRVSAVARTQRTGR